MTQPAPIVAGEESEKDQPDSSGAPAPAPKPKPKPKPRSAPKPDEAKSQGRKRAARGSQVKSSERIASDDDASGKYLCFIPL